MCVDNRTCVELRPGIVADATGALFLAASSTLLIADAHLGYAWAQRRRGELGPLTDGGIAAHIHAVVERWKPRQVVFLGDVVHLGKPSPAERASIEQTLSGVIKCAEVHIILGNHDRRFRDDFGHLALLLGYSWEDDEVLAIHGDREFAETHKLLVLGHLHPAITLEDAVGARQRLPVFVHGERALLLPAFSPFAAGFDLRKPLPAEWRDVFPEGQVQLAATTGTQVRMLPRSFPLRFRSPEGATR